QRGIFEQLAGLLHDFDEIAARDFAQHIAGALGFLDVLGEQAGIRLADLGQRFTSDKMNDVIDFEARVRLAPAQNRNVYHNSTSVMIVKRKFVFSPGVIDSPKVGGFKKILPLKSSTDYRMNRVTGSGLF